ncbi:MAG: LysR family transcriptional regulator [Moraxellaceae bacterium]|nr:LysR family transcriptional regulator [Moraxellaceae bacterium]MDZ4386997.1 LysR family transcriptional regulator [Moraxellaceae bacterium]
MDTAVLNAFLAVAKQNSFSQAAEQLHVTQPAVSKRIQQLEEQLGVKLFDRVGRRVVLTEAGRALLPRAKQWLHELDDIRRLAQDYAQTATGELSGTLTMGTSHHIGLHRLPNALRAFSHQHPQVRLDIRFIDSEQAYDAVLSGELELGIVTLPPELDERLISQVIWPDPLAFVVAANHPLAQLARQQCHIDASDLANHPAILPSTNTFTRQIAEAMFQREGLRLQVHLETNYLETIKMMVSIGLGWSVLPATMCDQDVIATAVSHGELTRQLGVVHHPRRSLSRAAQAMLKLLQHEASSYAVHQRMI